MEEIKRTIKQIMPIESGWTCKYLYKQDDEFTLCSIPVTGQALVETTYPDDETPPHGYVEAICFDEGMFLIETELPSYHSENTLHIGLQAPGDTVDEKQLENFRKVLVTKMERIRTRKAAKVAA